MLWCHGSGDRSGEKRLDSGYMLKGEQVEGITIESDILMSVSLAAVPRSHLLLKMETEDQY